MELSEKQTLEDGVGPVFHRIYSMEFTGKGLDSKTIMSELKTDMNRFSPQMIATFEKTKGHQNALKKGDEFLIRILGPWNGPVRVSEAREDLLCLETLEGHLEAGQVLFSVTEKNPSHFIFKIESIARSRDEIVDLCYDKIPIAKYMQTEMWTSFCKNFADVISKKYGATFDQDVQVITQRKAEGSTVWENQ